MARGGARKGAGRIAGVPNKKSVALIERAKELGVEPIDVMLGNMKFFHEGSIKFTDRLMAVAEKITPEDFIEGGECVKDLFKLVEKVNYYREQAQSCAVDAAPYIHPRLAAIAVSHNADDELTKAITEKMSPKEAAEIYQALIR